MLSAHVTNSTHARIQQEALNIVTARFNFPQKCTKKIAGRNTRDDVRINVTLSRVRVTIAAVKNE
jgi:hypothetical protein